MFIYWPTWSNRVFINQIIRIFSGVRNLSVIVFMCLFIYMWVCEWVVRFCRRNVKFTAVWFKNSLKSETRQYLLLLTLFFLRTVSCVCASVCIRESDDLLSMPLWGCLFSGWPIRDSWSSLDRAAYSRSAVAPSSNMLCGKWHNITFEFLLERSSSTRLIVFFLWWYCLIKWLIYTLIIT